MKYSELIDIQKTFKVRYTCLFGAGLIGCTWAYDLLRIVGFRINFYCDNNKKEDSIIKENIKVTSLETLYSLKDEVLVFVTVADKYQKEIKTQLMENGINNIIGMDYLFLQEFIESLLEINTPKIKEKFKCILDDVEYLSQQFEYRMGYSLNLDDPQTFNEKLQWLKLYDRRPEYTQLVDKYAVKKFVTEKIGEEYINPTLGVWNSFDDIIFDKLPESFVLKCTHDSGSMVVCKDKKGFNKETAKDILDAKLNLNFFWSGREWPYKGVDRKIIAEKYLENHNGEGIIDYKFLCSNGKVKYIFTCSERNTESGLCVNFYEKDWRPLPFERHYHKRKEEIEKPEKLTEMIMLAEKLAIGLKFVRVDFFIVDKKIYFSELTFYPGGGMEEFTPSEWDWKLGKMIEI